MASFPHDSATFTQGLFWHEGTLYESSGLYGKSFVQQIRPGAKQPLNRQPLAKTLFAEGVTRVGRSLYLLTWREQTLLKLNAATLAIESRLPYRGEGWGITHDGERFITSDGSSRLTLRNTKSFKPEQTVRITLAGEPVRFLNELEYINGQVWANVWREPVIVVIQPDTGLVDAVLDLSPLVKLNDTQPGHSVLNGIAWDDASQTLWVTGKLWPNLYQLKITEPAQPKPIEQGQNEQ